MIGSSLEVAFKNYSELENIEFLTDEVRILAAMLQSSVEKLGTESRENRNPVRFIIYLQDVERSSRSLAELTEMLKFKINQLHVPEIRERRAE